MRIHKKIQGNTQQISDQNRFLDILPLRTHCIWSSSHYQTNWRKVTQCCKNKNGNLRMGKCLELRLILEYMSSCVSEQTWILLQAYRFHEHPLHTLPPNHWEQEEPISFLRGVQPLQFDNIKIKEILIWVQEDERDKNPEWMRLKWCPELLIRWRRFREDHKDPWQQIFRKAVVNKAKTSRILIKSEYLLLLHEIEMIVSSLIL